MIQDHKQVIQNANMTLMQNKKLFAEEDYTTLQKRFPAFAIRLLKSGDDCSTDALSMHLQKGLSHISGYFKSDKNLKRTYNAIVKSFAKPEPKGISEGKAEEAIDAAKRGNIEHLKQMKRDGFGSFKALLPIHKNLLSIGFSNGDLDLVKYALSCDEKVDNYYIISAASHAMREGHLELLKYVKEELGLTLSSYERSPLSMYIGHAIKNNHWDVVDYVAGHCFENISQSQDLLKTMFEAVVDSGQVEALHEFIRRGIQKEMWEPIDLEMRVHSAMPYDIFKTLCDDYNFFDYKTLTSISKGGCPGTLKSVVNLAEKRVREHEQFSMMERLKHSGRLLKAFCGEAYGPRGNKSTAVEINRKLNLPKIFIGSANRQAAKFYEMWENRFGSQPLTRGLLNPDLVKMKAFKETFKIFKNEGLMASVAAEYAYHTSALFGSTDRVLQYLEKWGEAAQQPLHDVAYMIEVPQKGDLDLKTWGDAVLQHGPKMAKFVKFSGQINTPLRSNDGSVFSYQKTREEIAKFSYKKGQKNPVWAQECLKHGWKENQYEDGLGLIKKYQKKYATNENKKGEKIPEFSLDGQEFEMPGYKFYKLPDGDYRGLLLGEYTACCQHLANAGRDCAAHGFLSENGGFYVVEDKQGQIVGQTWAWRGEHAEITLDSLEFLPERMNKENWQKICEKMGADLLQNHNEVSALNIGASGRTPCLDFKAAAQCAKPVDYSKYRDSEDRQYQVMKR